MRFFLPRQLRLIALFIVLPLTGCILRTQPVARQLSTTPLKEATRDELVAYVNAQAAQMKSLQATVDIDTTVGGEKRGKITDYQQIRGYVLARKPSMLRMKGLTPVVRNTAFDMVSNGNEFKLWIPSKNRFVEGRNDVATLNPKQPLENMRPQYIYDALLLREIDPQQDIAVLEGGLETVFDAKKHPVDQPDYELNVIRKGDHGWFLSRKIIFSRTDLLPHRQITYHEDGDPATIAGYEGYKEYSGLNFPSQIHIRRPEEEYDITLAILKLQLNEPLEDDKFVLDQPDGADVIQLNDARRRDGSRAEARVEKGK